MRSSFEARPFSASAEFVADASPANPGGGSEATMDLEARLEIEREVLRQELQSTLGAEFESRVAAALEALETAGNALRDRDREERAALPEALLALAVGIAERILRQELETRPEAILPVLGEALEALGGRDPSIVQLAPATLSGMRSRHADALERFEETWRARFEGDAELTGGDARVIAGPRQVSLEIAPLLERIRRTLTDDVDGGAPA